MTGQPVPGDPDLAALVSARLCHDLISPIGAIGNGLELLQMSQPTASAELDLVGDSLNSALARIGFFRIAFGPAEAQARLSADEIRGLTGAMFQGRLTVSWTCLPADLSRQLTRLTFLAILCLDKSLPMGGMIDAGAGPDGITLRVEGRRTLPPEALWAHALAGAPLEGLRSENVQFAFLRQMLNATGCQLTAEFTASSAHLRLTSDALTPA